MFVFGRVMELIERMRLHSPVCLSGADGEIDGEQDAAADGRSLGPHALTSVASSAVCRLIHLHANGLPEGGGGGD